ncbi:MAG TPA: hypothetical protein VK932_05915, partial [Kofleriaceae bacterium]|nr:hypothetical protein [Kofleriaceae bacterium]
MGATIWTRNASWVALCISGVIAHQEAHAGECTPSTPECHLENGSELLDSDPKRAADELLASYKLDERTDTLALYATALERARRYASALETWQRVIVFRESELDAAKAAARSSSSRKRAAARTAKARAQKGLEQAAEAIIRLWPSVGKARVRVPAGQQIAVSRDGIEVDVSRDVLVNAGRDELVFTRKDGSAARVVVEVAAGGSVKIDAPAEQVATPAPKPAPAPMKPMAAEEAEPVAASARPAPPLAKVRLVDEPRSPTMSRIG